MPLFLETSLHIEPVFNQQDNIGIHLKILLQKIERVADLLNDG